MRRVDIGIGIFVVGFGLVSLWQSLQLDLYQRGGVPGAGMFPTLLAIALSLLGALLIVSRIRGNTTDFGEFVGIRKADLQRPAVAGAAFVISIALLPFIGFGLAMLALAAALLFGVERLRTIPAAITVIALPLLFYIVFGVLLNARLPGGFFE